jgi:steroid delta-isomerase-like uncharacterized protein
MADMKALTRRFYDEVFGKGDMAALDELVDDDLIEHEELAGIPGSKEGLIEFVKQLRAGIPDITCDIHAMVAEGDEVWAHVTMRGTHQGEFLGIPATGKSIAVETIDRIRVRNDKAVEHWGVTDTFGMMQQLGVIPE